MKRAALYMRVSTVDQHPESQVHDLRQMAAQRGYEIIQEYTDRISGTKAKRPGLDQLMTWSMATVRVMEPPSSHVALLHRISSIVSSELSLDEMLGEIVGLTAQVTECDACLVYLLEADSDEVVLRASQVPHAAALGNLRMKMGEGVTGWVAGRTGERPVG